MKKRVLSWLLTILLAFSLVTPADKAYAAGNEGSGSEQEQLEYEAVFPDAAFRQQICVGYGFDADNDGIIDDDELEAMAQREVLMLGLSEYYPDPIESLKGIEFFSGLKTLYVNDCGLKSLDITGNTQLKELNCKNNRIETLDLGVNSLTNVWCQGNPGITIDIRNHALLNQAYIKALAGPMGIIPDPDGNFGVSAAEWNEEQNGFDVCASVTYSQDATVLYTPSDPGQQDPGEEEQTLEEMFPDPTFRAIVMFYYDTDKNGELSEEEWNLIENETDLYVNAGGFDGYPEKPVEDDAEIETLKGVEFFENLQNLFCGGRGIKTLDISENQYLVFLDCKDNALTELNVSFDNLKTVYCQGNPNLVIDLGNNDMLNRAYATYVANGECPNQEGYCIGDVYEQINENEMLGVGGLAFSPDATVLYDESYLPDDEEEDMDFYWYAVLSEYDTDNSGELSDEELLAVTAVELNWWYPSSLKGIERLKNLESLSCDGNNLTQVDLTENTGLKKLTLSALNLTSLDLSNNTELTEVEIVGNFDALDFSNNEKLTAISVDGYSGEELFLIGNPSVLKELRLAGCAIDDISGIAALTELEKMNLSGMNIQSIDVSSLSKLESLRCSEIKLEEIIGLSNLTALRILDLGENNLTSLDVSNLSNLTELYCYNNKLASLKVGPQTFAVLHASANADLQAITGFEDIMVTGYLGVGETAIGSLDISRFTELKYLDCYKCGLTELNIDNNPDIRILDCSNNSISVLSISSNDALFYLDCAGNAITSLDITANPSLLMAVRGTSKEGKNGNLIYLNGIGGKSYWEFPYERSLSVDKNTEIIQGENEPSQEELETIRLFPDPAFRNRVLELFDDNLDCIIDEDELDKISEFDWLDLSDCGIKDLTGIEYFTEVTGLFVGVNELEILDISKNTKITTLACARNHITSIDITGIPGLIKAYEMGSTFIDQLVDEQDNKYDFCSYSYSAMNGESYSLDCDTNVEIIREKSEEEAATIRMFPDKKFRTYVLAQFDDNLDLVIDDDELADIGDCTMVTLFSYGIEDLTGIEYFTGLQYLDCSWNKLTKLELSANTQLVYLNCEYNMLSSLDISANTELFFLDCAVNPMTQLDISAAPKLVNAYLSDWMELTYIVPAPTDENPDASLEVPVHSYYDSDEEEMVFGESIVYNSLNVDPALAIKTGKPYFSAIGMVLSEEIGLRFALTIPEGFEFSTENQSFSYAVSGTIYYIPMSEAQKLDENTYVFTCPLNPLQFADTVEAQFHWDWSFDEEWNVINDRYIRYTTSAEKYCDELDLSDEKLLNLVKSLKNYAYAVSQSGWSDGYGHDEIDDELPDYSDEEIEEMKENVVSELFEDGVAMQINLMGSGISDIRVSLSLLDKTIMNIYVLPEDGAEVYDYDDVRYIGGERYYVIRTKPVGPLNLGTMKEIEIGTNVGTLVFKACPMSYVYSFLSGSVNSAKNLAMIMYYEYYQSAVAYQSSRNQ